MPRATWTAPLMSSVVRLSFTCRERASMAASVIRVFPCKLSSSRPWQPAWQREGPRVLATGQWVVFVSEPVQARTNK